jgi:mono/diheme cytochrome c family protein
MRLASFLILSFSIAIAGISHAETPAAPLARHAAQSATPAGDVENGRKIYSSYGCYQCHNYAANGGAAGPRLAPRPIPYTAFVRYLRQPSGQMPPYTVKVVSDQEIANIYAFLLTVPAPPTIDSISILKP